MLNGDLQPEPVQKSPSCPLCRTPDAGPFHQDKFRNYYHCSNCSLVFVAPEQFLSREKEKAEYDLHRNSPEDQNYRNFLSRLFLPMRKQLAPGSHGLDFGSGPGPTLSLMFEEAGFPMTLHDPFYANNPSSLDREYDFITASEVVEHLHNPQMELERLWQCLRPGGILGIMTKLALDRRAFRHWHYKNDLTHVCFFSRTTFEWLAERWRAGLVFADKDVILFGKNG